ncbi:MAG: hypothetical protein M5U28_49185 [Sandaracinaceae bacterium]|nr:hypothetical protein [Sandaracinaceae bacterium]
MRTEGPSSATEIAAPVLEASTRASGASVRRTIESGTESDSPGRITAGRSTRTE